jgi:hypothetical protein
LSNWKDYVRKNLAPLGLEAERELELIEELAQHLEAVYEDALSTGASEPEAMARVENHVRDWRLLECELTLARRPTTSALHSHAGSLLKPRKTGIEMGTFVQDSYWGKDLLLVLRPWGGSQLILNPSLDLGVLGFTTAISIWTGVLFGLVPALRATRVDLAPALKETARSVTSLRSLFSKSLMVLQVAMSLVLLIEAAPFVPTRRNLERVDVGFNRDNLLTFSVDPELNGYKEQGIANLYHRLTERIGQFQAFAWRASRSLRSSAVARGSPRYPCRMWSRQPQETTTHM